MSCCPGSGWRSEHCCNIRSNIRRGLVDVVALAARVELIVLAGAVDRIDAGDVVAGQRLLDAVVSAVHHGRGDCRFPQAQGVTELVGRDGHEVIVRVDLPVDAGIEDDVTGIGAAVGRWGQEGLGEDPGPQRDRADADVTKPRIVLLVARDPTACPPSETSARLALVAPSQSDAACSICPSQVAVGNFAFKVENRALETPPMLVPSGMKL